MVMERVHSCWAGRGGVGKKSFVWELDCFGRRKVRGGWAWLGKASGRQVFGVENLNGQLESREASEVLAGEGPGREAERL